jgi:hypothetical protein
LAATAFPSVVLLLLLVIFLCGKVWLVASIFYATAMASPNLQHGEPWKATKHAPNFFSKTPLITKPAVETYILLPNRGLQPVVIGCFAQNKIQNVFHMKLDQGNLYIKNVEFKKI